MIIHGGDAEMRKTLALMLNISSRRVHLLARLLKKYHGVVAGSVGTKAALALKGISFRARDVDIWLPANSVSDGVVMEFAVALKTSFPRRSSPISRTSDSRHNYARLRRQISKVFTLTARLPPGTLPPHLWDAWKTVQIIATKEPPTDIQEGFDLSCSQVSWDGARMWMPDTSLSLLWKREFAIMSKALRMQSPAEYFRTWVRVAKYESRGLRCISYAPYELGLQPIIALDPHFVESWNRKFSRPPPLGVPLRLVRNSKGEWVTVSRPPPPGGYTYRLTRNSKGEWRIFRYGRRATQRPGDFSTGHQLRGPS
jgi:hypothetical protein